MTESYKQRAERIANTSRNPWERRQENAMTPERRTEVHNHAESWRQITEPGMSWTGQAFLDCEAELTRLEQAAKQSIRTLEQLQPWLAKLPERQSLRDVQEVLAVLGGALTRAQGEPTNAERGDAPTPERTPETWRDLPVGAWFFMDSPNCTNRYSVQARTDGGCVLVCSTPWTHERAKRDMQVIAGEHNRLAYAEYRLRAGQEEAKPFGWWDVFNACLWRSEADAERARAGGNEVVPLFRRLTGVLTPERKFRKAPE